MARNEDRRRLLADAGIAVLAAEGMRGLTHRAVDARAAVPTGTASNYFRTRDALVGALVERIGERLAPDPAVHAQWRDRAPDPALFADYTRDIVRRLTSEREVTLALFTLRLEAARSPGIAAALGDWMRTGFAADVAFNRDAGLPGGAFEIALFHYAIEGLILDRLTVSIDPDTSTDEIVEAFVAGLLGGDASGRR
ncbi:TetR family transcriptional regulator [Microbacterium sp. M3]|uniref:TetR family transcriptional regulator n=1 Tax=Microbacterium arthrosphaerae TaxID=792652 RepID=A0ABU4GYK7_9MICO|nr:MULTISPECIES: TetR family transcriptional regulator [Microbacterium]MDW4571544.1 TetR family transcriptional regulator [Microbacterium arthrosphaerae]MDW7605399.1 TetR family transcriptional regulator [Microbacterium sp. M3]